MHPQLRSTSLCVKDIENIPVGEGDTLRIANFSPGGFLLFSAQEDNVTTLGFSDNGQLHMSDTVGNPALRMVMNNVGTLIPGLGKDDLNPGTLPPQSLYPRTIYQYREQNKVEEYKPSVFPFFGQKVPFNKRLYNPTSGKHISVGCGPVAILGILSHYRLQGVNGVQVDWDWLFKKKEAFSQYTYDVAPEFDQFAELAKRVNEHCYLIRNGSYSMCTPRQVSNLLERNGFEVNRVDYKSSEIVPYLQQNKIPVIMFGWVKGEGFFDLQAHFWIIDGLLRVDIGTYKAVVNRPEDTPNYVYEGFHESQYYVHCNWGWGGACNGYFRYHIFNHHGRHYYDNLTRPSSLRPLSLISAKPDDYFSVSMMKITRK